MLACLFSVVVVVLWVSLFGGKCGVCLFVVAVLLVVVMIGLACLVLCFVVVVFVMLFGVCVS